MSAPLLVRALARSALQVRSSCHNVLPSAARNISHTSKLLILTNKIVYTRTSPTHIPSTPQKASFTRSSRFSILQFTKNTVWRATHQDQRLFGGQKPPSHKPEISWIDALPPSVIFWGIFAINLSVYMVWSYAEGAVRTLKDPSTYIWMLQNFTVSMDNVKSGRVWTILTSCFSQKDTTHLLFNGFTYFFMARPVLSMLGNRQFLIIYLGGGIISSLTSLLWNNVIRETPTSSLGASGAIYAILSYFACRLPYSKILIFGVIPVPAWAFVPGVLLYDGYEMMSKHTTSKTDAAGHVGGILAGALYYVSRIAGIRL